MKFNDDKHNRSDYKSEPGMNIKLKHIIIGIIIILFFIVCTCLVAFNIYKESDMENSLSNISEMFNSDDSDEDKSTSSSVNTVEKDKTPSTAEKKSSSNKEKSESTDISTFSIEEYAKYCTDKTFGAHAYNDRSCFRQVNYQHNNYTVYINIGTHKNRDTLNSAAVNASVELYKALYTIYPDKFANTLFGVYVSGSYVDDNGNTTESDEVMFSWFDEKTLKSTDINSLTPDNLQNVVYRYFNPYQRISIQRD